MEEKHESKLRPAIFWTRDRIKEYHPGGGTMMTAVLNLWHILRESPVRHGCQFDYIWSYRWSTERLLKTLRENGWFTDDEIRQLWDAMVCQTEVSHHPPDYARENWMRFPDSLLKEKTK